MREMTAHTRKEATLGSTIRRELGSQANRTFLSRLPAFKPEPDLPEHLLALLVDLERAEAQVNGDGD